MKFELCIVIMIPNVHKGKILGKSVPGGRTGGGIMGVPQKVDNFFIGNSFYFW